ncbi:MAG: choice-of-anchor A family protein [Calothrix sp. C42_A2020_038]|nr:choice-of-anchor A family protein [Calothrix sp. C42_A2020_038]
MTSKKSIHWGIATIPIAASLLLGLAETVKAAELGIASDYNVFVLGDIQQKYTDIEGRLAAGGNINYVGGIGSRLAPNSGNVVVAGGNLTMSNGQVFNGNAVYGQAVNVSSNVGIPQGTLLQGNPIDFNQAANQLEQLSQYLSTLAPTGTTTVQAWGGINLEGSGQKLNVFNLLGADLSKANYFQISADPDSTVVVNISGKDVSMKNFGFNITGTTRSKVLYNFFEATSITASGIGIEGSILAPLANFQFDNGQINGNVIVASLSGNGESHNYLFDGDLPDLPTTNPDKTPVPEPASILGIGLIAGIAIKKHNHHKAQK